LKTRWDTYREKIMSRQAATRIEAIRELAARGNAAEAKVLLKFLATSKQANGLVCAVHTIGQARNRQAREALIDVYGKANHTQRKKILEALLNIGAFEKVIPGDASTPQLLENLWRLAFGNSSDQLRRIMNLRPEEFEKALDFARKTTAHWNKE